jgi:isopenicillin N synthase-like dioxygenase
MTEALPIIDVGTFIQKRPSAAATVRARSRKACREFGFFYATGHGVGGKTVRTLKEAGARFFAPPETRRWRSLSCGGHAWRAISHRPGTNFGSAEPKGGALFR